MSIAIVTDSTSDLPKDVVEKHGITVVPLNVRFGMEEFKDGIDIDNDEFYRRLQIESDHLTALTRRLLRGVPIPHRRT